MYEPVRQIWEEERIPEEWKEAQFLHTKEETEIGMRITGEQHWEMQLTKFCRI